MIFENFPEFQKFLIFHQLVSDQDKIFPNIRQPQKYKIIEQATAVNVFLRTGPPLFNISSFNDPS
jgi:hypothetical protein